ncbi:hypothetical protein [Burkholderia cepacia]|uniref:hypothetical protein n=1 Tax=Burkholderia cepacia TaxID=292 RepID=UPI0012D9E706|nr:hypothetical protein [Burkholderia cepacia]
MKDLYPDVVPRLKRLRETGVLAGMVPVFLRRGPWAIIQSGSGRFASPVHAIDSLSALGDITTSRQLVIPAQTDPAQTRIQPAASAPAPTSRGRFCHQVGRI